jgi:hypothetical protein
MAAFLVDAKTLSVSDLASETWISLALAMNFIVLPSETLPSVPAARPDWH